MIATTRSVFDHQLNQLQFKTVQLSELVATQAVQAIKALHKHDITIAQCVDAFDAKVNQLRYEIEEQCYTLLALQQPNAGDMRRIVATVSVVTNLERMGDHAAGIARLTMRMQNHSTVPFPDSFNEMADIANASLADAMTAFEKNDINLARDVINRDDQVDRLHQEVYDHLIKTMTNDPSTVESATMMMWVSHNLERYADRVSNICERILYVVTGDLHAPRIDKIA